MSNQNTLTAVFESSALKSPKISELDSPTDDAMIWFLRQLDPHVGQSAPTPMDFAPKMAWVSLEPQRLHRTQILCITCNHVTVAH